MNYELKKIVELQDLTAQEFTNDFCEIIKQEYGSHLYKIVVKIIESKLKL